MYNVAEDRIEQDPPDQSDNGTTANSLQLVGSRNARAHDLSDMKKTRPKKTGMRPVQMEYSVFSVCKLVDAANKLDDSAGAWFQNIV
ncbi:hypothetical protein EJB05_02826 [Eragrostis curvula]|uniref:Uncharacterized protein n=1 Tax=Eragrostis curvula TaxID=38414 RepID=A0A5J9WU28_9POAL|nr:hypothetical protein EJB05_02826 [Eragrostis curvula]